MFLKLFIKSFAKRKVPITFYAFCNVGGYTFQFIEMITISHQNVQIPRYLFLLLQILAYFKLIVLHSSRIGLCRSLLTISSAYCFCIISTVERQIYETIVNWFLLNRQKSRVSWHFFKRTKFLNKKIFLGHVLWPFHLCIHSSSIITSISPIKKLWLHRLTWYRRYN